MYLKEAIIVGFIALGIILFNFGIKFYYIFKRGYRISNLIIIKLISRAICTSCFVGILILGFNTKSNITVNTKGDVLFFTLPLQKENAKFEIDDISKQKIAELIKLYKYKKIGLIGFRVDVNKYYLAIPPTTQSVFLNLVESKYLMLDASYLKELSTSDIANLQLLDLTLKGSERKDIKEDENVNFDYLNNLLEIPFLKVYLLILLLVLVASELILKLKIIKI
jgi:hypothetical protein